MIVKATAKVEEEVKDELKLADPLDKEEAKAILKAYGVQTSGTPRNNTECR